MGKPLTGRTVRSCAEFIAVGGDTEGSETSQYLEENKTCDSPSSGERKGNSPNSLNLSLQALFKEGCGAVPDSIAVGSFCYKAVV